MEDDIKPKYKADYKTSDPNWWNPPNSALRGSNLVVRFKKLTDNAQLPEFKSELAAGMDLSSVERVVLPSVKTAGSPGIALVSTGLAMALPPGYEAQIRPRSGLAAKHGVTVLNSPGTIDADYRGPLKVVLVNHGPEDFVVEPGDRIAQMVIAKVEQMSVLEVADLDETNRGSGGFGSTGVK